jgi:hypothetical protein
MHVWGVLPGQNSSHLSVPGCSALPNPPGSVPVAPSLLDLLRAAPAVGSAQDGILGEGPTTRRKKRTGMEKTLTELEYWILVLSLTLAVELWEDYLFFL